MAVAVIEARFITFVLASNVFGKETSGKTIIANYYQDIYPNETANFMTKVNALRLRTISLSYNLPKTLLAKTKV